MAYSSHQVTSSGRAAEERRERSRCEWTRSAAPPIYLHGCKKTGHSVCGVSYLCVFKPSRQIFRASGNNHEGIGGRAAKKRKPWAHKDVR